MMKTIAPNSITTTTTKPIVSAVKALPSFLRHAPFLLSAGSVAPYPPQTNVWACFITNVTRKGLMTKKIRLWKCKAWSPETRTPARQGCWQ